MRAGASLVLFAAVFELAACSSQDGTLIKPAEVPPPPAATMPKRSPQVSPVRRKVASLLEKKNYRQAVELMHGKNREGLEKEFVLAMNGLLEVGEEAFSLGDYETSARAFKGLLGAYPVEALLRERIRCEQKQVRSFLDACVNRMMEQGIEEYRRGRLENAIRKWRLLLAISPGHQEAKKALNTATVQLQALQNLRNM